eukprot:1679831-Rhodomonas_salina.2
MARRCLHGAVGAANQKAYAPFFLSPHTPPAPGSSRPLSPHAHPAAIQSLVRPLRWETCNVRWYEEVMAVNVTGGDDHHKLVV